MFNIAATRTVLLAVNQCPAGLGKVEPPHLPLVRKMKMKQHYMYVVSIAPGTH